MRSDSAEDIAKLMRRYALEAVACGSPEWRRWTLFALAYATRAALLRLREREAVTRGGPKE